MIITEKKLTDDPIVNLFLYDENFEDETYILDLSNILNEITSKVEKDIFK